MSDWWHLILIPTSVVLGLDGPGMLLVGIL
jgi:hypothetical protein